MDVEYNKRIRVLRVLDFCGVFLSILTAFCSERSIKFSCSNGELVRIHYKVGYPHNSLYVN